MSKQERLTRIDGKAHYLGKLLPPGPWHDEPDRVDFEAHGFSCLLLRNGMGAWCGYVATPPGHPWHGKGYDDVRVGDDDWPSVHGGLTYAGRCSGEICHLAKPGEPDDVWWFGFDCVHCYDVSPTDRHWDDSPSFADIRAKYGPRRGEYRTVEYARRETESLARQAREAAP